MALGESAVSRSVAADTPVTADAAPWRSSGLVLVVDDEPAVARVTSLVLDECGFDVAVAHNADEAMKHLERYGSKVRVVLVDLAMPHKSGVDVMQAARSAGFEVPMVLTSGFPHDEADKRFSDEGFVGYLQKPYRLETLVAVLKDALGE